MCPKNNDNKDEHDKSLLALGDYLTQNQQHAIIDFLDLISQFNQNENKQRKNKVIEFLYKKTIASCYQGTIAGELISELHHLFGKGGKQAVIETFPKLPLDPPEENLEARLKEREELLTKQRALLEQQDFLETPKVLLEQQYQFLLAEQEHDKKLLENQKKHFATTDFLEEERLLISGRKTYVEQFLADVKKQEPHKKISKNLRVKIKNLFKVALALSHSTKEIKATLTETPQISDDQLNKEDFINTENDLATFIQELQKPNISYTTRKQEQDQKKHIASLAAKDAEYMQRLINDVLQQNEHFKIVPDQINIIKRTLTEEKFNFLMKRYDLTEENFNSDYLRILIVGAITNLHSQEWRDNLFVKSLLICFKKLEQDNLKDAESLIKELSAIRDKKKSNSNLLEEFKLKKEELEEKIKSTRSLEERASTKKILANLQQEGDSLQKERQELQATEEQLLIALKPMLDDNLAKLKETFPAKQEELSQETLETIWQLMFQNFNGLWKPLIDISSATDSAYQQSVEQKLIDRVGDLLLSKLYRDKYFDRVIHNQFFRQDLNTILAFADISNWQIFPTDQQKTDSKQVDISQQDDSSSKMQKFASNEYLFHKLAYLELKKDSVVPVLEANGEQNFYKVRNLINANGIHGIVLIPIDCNKSLDLKVIFKGSASAYTDSTSVENCIQLQAFKQYKKVILGNLNTIISEFKAQSHFLESMQNQVSMNIGGHGCGGIFAQLLTKELVTYQAAKEYDPWKDSFSALHANINKQVLAEQDLRRNLGKDPIKDVDNYTEQIRRCTAKHLTKTRNFIDLEIGDDNQLGKIKKINLTTINSGGIPEKVRSTFVQSLYILNNNNKKKLEEYELCLLSDLNGEEPKEKNKLYIYLYKGNIIYKVLGVDGEVKSGTITPDELNSKLNKGELIPKKNDLDQFNLIKETIMNITSERGHTPVKFSIECNKTIVEGDLAHKTGVTDLAIGVSEDLMPTNFLKIDPGHKLEKLIVNAALNAFSFAVKAGITAGTHGAYPVTEAAAVGISAAANVVASAMPSSDASPDIPSDIPPTVAFRIASRVTTAIDPMGANLHNIMKNLKQMHQCITKCYADCFCGKKVIRPEIKYTQTNNSKDKYYLMNKELYSKDSTLNIAALRFPYLQRKRDKDIDVTIDSPQTKPLTVDGFSNAEVVPIPPIRSRSTSDLPFRRQQQKTLQFPTPPSAAPAMAKQPFKRESQSLQFPIIGENSTNDTTHIDTTRASQQEQIHFPPLPPAVVNSTHSKAHYHPTKSKDRKHIKLPPINNRAIHHAFNSLSNESFSSGSGKEDRFDDLLSSNKDANIISGNPSTLYNNIPDFLMHLSTKIGLPKTKETELLSLQNFLKGLEKEIESGEKEKKKFLYSQDLNNKTPLQLAIEHGKPEDLNAIINCAARLGVLERVMTTSTKEGESLLQLAIRLQRPNMVIGLLNIQDFSEELLLKEDANGNIALHTAIKTGDLTTIEALLLKIEENINKKALRQDYINIKNLTGEKQETALHLAAQQGNVEIFKLLVKKGGLVDSSILKEAIKAGSTDIVAWMLSEEFKKLMEEKTRTTPLQPYYVTLDRDLLELSIKSNNAKTVKVLLEHLQVANEGVVTVFSDLLKRSATKFTAVKKRDLEKMLHLAVKQQNKDIILALLKKGVDINAKNNAGKTIFHVAVEFTDQKFFIELLDELKKQETPNIDFNVTNHNCETVLHIATLSGKLEIVKKLLEQPNINFLVDKVSKTRRRNSLELAVNCVLLLTLTESNQKEVAQYMEIIKNLWSKYKEEQKATAILRLYKLYNNKYGEEKIKLLIQQISLLETKDSVRSSLPTTTTSGITRRRGDSKK